MTRRSIMRARSHAGFSLAELVIALGIMAVGLVMVATLFPMGLKTNKDAVRTVLGSIICENGIATAKARFSVYKEPPTASILQPVADDNTDAVGGSEDIFIPDASRYHPTGDETSPYGYIVAARRVDDDEDSGTFEGYQVVVSSYQRKRADQPNNKVVWGQMYGGLLIADPEKPTLAYYDYDGLMQRGSPAINAANGLYSTIEQVSTVYDPGTPPQRRKSQFADLDRPLDLTKSSVPRILVVTEQYGPDPKKLQLAPFSPAMATMVSRFGLVKLDEDTP